VDSNLSQPRASIPTGHSTAGNAGFYYDATASYSETPAHFVLQHLLRIELRLNRSASRADCVVMVPARPASEQQRPRRMAQGAIALHRAEHETSAEPARAEAVPRMTDEAVWKIITARKQQRAINNVVQDAIRKGIVDVEEEAAAISWATLEAYERDLVRKCYSGRYDDYFWSTLTERIRGWVKYGSECPRDPRADSSIENHMFPAPNSGAGTGDKRSRTKVVIVGSKRKHKRIACSDVREVRMSKSNPGTPRGISWAHYDYDLAEQDDRDGQRETALWDRRARAEWWNTEGKGWNEHGASGIWTEADAARAEAEAVAGAVADAKARDEARTSARAEQSYRIDGLPVQYRQVARLMLDGCTLEKIAEQTGRRTEGELRKLKAYMTWIKKKLGWADQSQPTVKKAKPTPALRSSQNGGGISRTAWARGQYEPVTPEPIETKTILVDGKPEVVRVYPLTETPW
jgi:hypothetical protein